MKELQFKDLETQNIKAPETAPLVGVDFVNANEANLEFVQNGTPFDSAQGKQKSGFFKAIFRAKKVEEKPELYTREDTIPPKWALIKAPSKSLELMVDEEKLKNPTSLEELPTTHKLRGTSRGAEEKPKKTVEKEVENFYTFVPSQELSENQRIKLEIDKPKKAPKKSKPKKAKKEVIMPKVEKPTVEKIAKVKPKKVRKPHSPFQVFTWVLGILTLPFVFFFSLVLFFGEETWLEKLVMLLIFLMVFAISAGPMYVGGYVSITGQTNIFKAKFLRKNPRNAQAFGVILFLFGAALFYELFWKQLFGVII